MGHDTISQCHLSHQQCHRSCYSAPFSPSNLAPSTTTTSQLLPPSTTRQHSLFFESNMWSFSIWLWIRSNSTSTKLVWKVSVISIYKLISNIILVNVKLETFLIFPSLLLVTFQSIICSQNILLKYFSCLLSKIVFKLRLPNKLMFLFWKTICENCLSNSFLKQIK